jgi:hypothetical protein
MAEYIEREAAEDAVGEAHLKGLNPLWELRDVPTADVVPVVRCKECKHLFYTMCAACGFLPHKPNDFCSYGERKDGGGDND